MKRIGVMICVLAFIGMSHSAIAQAQVALGIKGGLNFASIDASTSVDSRTGFNAGAFALFKLTKIGIQPELLFSSQGFKLKDAVQDINSTYNYINIPVLLKIYLVAGLNLQLGPQFGFVSKAEVETVDLSGTSSVTDVKDQLKGSDISAALGLGWDLPFGLTVDGRYNLGLSDINDSAAASTVKNQVIQVSVGWKIIKLGK